MKSPAASGYRAETEALHYLERHKLKLIERNYRVRYGEIDLIMQDSSTIVFVEVRKRSNQKYGTASETIDSNKQRRLTMAAHSWMQKMHYSGDSRFDVVAIDGEKNISWIRNVFDEVDI